MPTTRPSSCASICDAELIQAIGRGRGVNRTDADPLEVHVLADVALALVRGLPLAGQLYWQLIRRLMSMTFSIRLTAEPKDPNQPLTVPWELVAPDIVQRMLLAGVAVDSPKDAATLHSALFSSVEQAEKAFERARFARQNPIRNLYREMSVKSASYRRGGRGRSWQRAWWIDGDQEDARSALEAALGALVEWLPGA